MELSKSEMSALYQRIDRSTNYQPATDAYISINNETLCPSFLEWEYEVSPSSSSLCSSSNRHSIEGRNFLSDGAYHPSQCVESVDYVRDSTVSVDGFNLKDMPIDATNATNIQNCKHSNCELKLKNFFSEIDPNCELKLKNVFSEIDPTSKHNDSGELVNLKAGGQKEQTNQFLALSTDTSFPNNISKSDPLESLQNIDLLPSSGDRQFEWIPRRAEFDTCRDSAVSIQRNTATLMHNDQLEMELPDSNDVCISKKLVCKVDLSNQRATNQPNSLKKPQTEVAPGWRKPPLPPRQTKPQAKSIHSNKVLNASHTYRGEKLQKLHGKKKMKAEGCPPNLTVYLALVFTFCFSLLIASSRK